MEAYDMTTIGTFFKEGDGYRGLVSTASVQGCARITPDPAEPGTYVLSIGERVFGHARADADGLAVTIHAPHAPAGGWARLIKRDGYYLLTV
tara:strand:- start:12146 stop:12421 length:276 start_codon:yes stop_codon:yes gene_type:complete